MLPQQKDLILPVPTSRALVFKELIKDIGKSADSMGIKNTTESYVNAILDGHNYADGQDEAFQQLVASVDAAVKI